MIKVRGARQHNLQNIDVDIPRGKLVVITGPSGSGKSSLAFHTLYAEGQRRYVESLSTYARQFLEQLEKPEVDSIEGLSPAIAIEQRMGGANPRSTIATVTEIYDFLRILFAAGGVPHDPETGERLQKMTGNEIAESLLGFPEGSKIVLLAPMQSVGDPAALAGEMQRSGFVRVRYRGEMVDLEDLAGQWSPQETDVEVVVDRLVVRDGMQSRLADSVETCLRICGAEARALVMRPDEDWQMVSFSTSYRNPHNGFVLPALEPKHFSFNSHAGACPVCHGTGETEFCDSRLLVPDTSVSLENGAIALFERAGKQTRPWRRGVASLITDFGVDSSQAFADLPETFKNTLLQGSYGGGSGSREFAGLCRLVEQQMSDRETKATTKRALGRFMASRPCAACGGQRLKAEILAVKLDHESLPLNINDFCALTVEEAPQWLAGLILPEDRATVLQGLVEEVSKRLAFMTEVGLGYLTLDRISSTLSGGEAQRIRLATQLGAGLGGVIYVLDEPSIGLHQEDNHKLIKALKRLRDIGNTVVVVEHDEETMEAADWLIDIGPGAGRFGGELLASGTPQQLKKCKESLTGQWLNRSKSVSLPTPLAPGEQSLTIVGADAHNLRSIDVTIPLGLMVCITGPSGSGKSTLVNDILYKALARHFFRANEDPGAHQGIEGMQWIDKVVVVDQRPIGKSPRSNAATYTGLFDHIRGLFAQLPLSKQRGYKQGRFSFNVKGGRCEKCLGDGFLKIDMHFLTDAYVVCDSCAGQRFNRETLEVHYKGKSIADVLAMTVTEAQGFFAAIPKVAAILNSLSDVGLGYLVLGQPANTLSGGEAQRIKLAAELAKPTAGGALYLFDEPTTGLHFGDVELLLGVLQRLRDAGNSVVIVEHNMEVVRRADWIIDLGPGGGKEGGEIVAEGPPEVIKKCKISLTGKWI